MVPAVEAEAAAVPALGCEGEGGEDPPGEGEREGEPRPSLSPADTLSLWEETIAWSYTGSKTSREFKVCNGRLRFTLQKRLALSPQLLIMESQR